MSRLFVPSDLNFQERFFPSHATGCSTDTSSRRTDGKQPPRRRGSEENPAVRKGKACKTRGTDSDTQTPWVEAGRHKRGSARRSSSRDRTASTERTTQQNGEPLHMRSKSLPKRAKFSEKSASRRRLENDGSTAPKGKSAANKMKRRDSHSQTARQSSSRDRMTTTERARQQAEKPVPRRSESLPKRTKVSEKTASRRRRESGGTKKKAPMRRTRSYESITTNRSSSNYGILVDSRGFPLTSVGSPPVASLPDFSGIHRTVSPNNVDTDNFDAHHGRRLQEEECPGARQRPSRPYYKRVASNKSCGSGSSGEDCKMPANPRSKSSKRSNRKDTLAHPPIVPLNPEESVHYLQKRYASNAAIFVQRLKALLVEVSGGGGFRNTIHSNHKDPIFAAVLTDQEHEELAVSMLLTQSKFRDSGKPEKLDVGYHFCSGNNIRRIQGQPGLWSNIQARGVNRSQDGDGIYTFDNPPPREGKDGGTYSAQEEDVWMAVARLQGTRSSATSHRRQWNDRTDALVLSENNVVVLRASTQFFPLLQFRTALSAGSVMHMHERLQRLLDTFFNASEHGIGMNPPAQSSFFSGKGVEAASDPAAWEATSEVQAVIEEHSAAWGVTMTGGEKPRFVVQSAVSAEEMVVLADNLLRTRQRFHDSHKPAYIDIGYHYCRGHNLKKMQQKRGFWSNIQSRGFNKSEDGDGIYTFNDPLGTRTMGVRGGFFDMRNSTSKDDDAWLLVARLQGNRQISAPSSGHSASSGRKWDEDVDAMIVGGRQTGDVVVLRTSAQFFPVLQFSVTSAGAEQHEILQELQMVHQRIQVIFDHFFNCRLVKGESIEDLLEYCAPNTLDAVKSIHSPSQQIYKILSHNKKAMNDDCSICLDSLRRTSHQQVVRLQNCGHEFHRACLNEALQHFDLCPICNTSMTPPAPQSCLQGLSPSGLMAATKASNTFCDGCWSPGGSIVLSFFLPAGIQKAYHENPGAGYSSSDWKAFLPYNEEGLRLLRRLQCAHLHGLLFTVKEGNAVRTTIPLKLRPSATGNGDDSGQAYPDSSYFEACDGELDRFGVPDFDGCMDFVRRAREMGNSTAIADTHASPNRSLLRLSTEEARACARVLKRLQEHQHGWMFCKALPALDGKVEKVMDFTIIENNLAGHAYTTVDDYARDVNLTFDNAMVCYSKENPIHYMAKQLKKKFKKDLRQLQA